MVDHKYIFCAKKEKLSDYDKNWCRDYLKYAEF